MGSMSAIIARGLPAIDPAADYYKLSDLALNNQQKRLELEQERQIQPLKLQALQQATEQRDLELQDARQTQQDYQTWRQAAADPQFGGDPLKILPAIVGKTSPKFYWGLAKQASDLTTAQLNQAKDQKDIALGHQDAMARLGAGVAANGYHLPSYAAAVHQGVVDKHMTPDEATALLQEATQDPSSIQRHVAGWVAGSPTVQTSATAAAEGRQKLETEKTAARKEEAIQASYAIQDDPSLQAWQTAYPEYKNLVPSSATYKTDTPQVIRMRLAVPVKEQPKVEMEQRQAGYLANLTPDTLVRNVNAVIPQDPKWSQLRATTTQLARQAVEAGLPLTTVQAIISGAADKVTHEESQLRIGRETLPFKMELKAAPGAAQPVAGGMVPGVTPEAAKLTGEDFLKTLPLMDQNVIRGMATGAIPSPGPNSRSPQAQRNLGLLMQYDPTFTTQRAQVRRAFTTGADAKNIGALNTAIVHLGRLYDTSEALKNGTFTPANEMFNYFKDKFGSATVTNFALLRDAVAGEMATALKGTATDQEIAHLGKSIRASNSPEQMGGIVREGIGILNDKANTYDERYHAQMKDDPWSPILPSAKATLQRFGVTKAGGGGTRPKVQYNEKTGQYRYSLDGGTTWQPGRPPQ